MINDWGRAFKYFFLDGKFGPLWKINVQELALFMFTSNFIFEVFIYYKEKSGKPNEWIICAIFANISV